MLAWLAPDCDKDSIQVEVPVEPYQGTELQQENGVIGRSALLNQLKSATKIIEEHNPERIIVFGGDCLVSQAPFAYFNEKYNGRLGILWLDAHPDICTPELTPHAHAMVLGNLLGDGDAEFAKMVNVPISPDHVMYCGLEKASPRENEIVNNYGIRIAESQELAQSSTSVLNWIKDNQIQHLAIHLDIDVLNPKLYRDTYSAKPEGYPYQTVDGTMTFEQISRLIKDAATETDIVCLSIAEHLPWDAYNLHTFLSELPIFGDGA
jgi:arginase